MDPQDELDNEEWQQIPSPSSVHKAHWFNHNYSPLAIKDDFLNAFPPPSHHDLPITNTEIARETSPIPPPAPLYSLLSFSSSSSSSLGETPKVEEGGEKSEDGDGWKRKIVREWWSGLVRVACEIKNSAACRMSLWYSVLAAGGVVSVVAVSLWWVKVARWRKRVQMERIEHLMLIIKDREQKINKLLLHIAQMNEMLLAPQKVPVLRVA